MTQYPEALLARELELCYANISLITDYDVGVEGVPPVTHEEVVRVFTENNEKLRDLLFAVIPALPASARLRLRDRPRRRPLRGLLEQRPVCSDHGERSGARAHRADLPSPRTRTPRRWATGSARRSPSIVGREALEEFRVRALPLVEHKPRRPAPGRLNVPRPPV